MQKKGMWTIAIMSYKENCGSHQFDYFPECDQELDPDVPDIHIQRQMMVKCLVIFIM